MTLSEYIDELEKLRASYGKCQVVITSVHLGVEVDDYFYAWSPQPGIVCDKARDFVSLGTVEI